MARRQRDLLAEIEADALDSGSDLARVLRKCITLGGWTGSERLRDWASLELKGYGPDDDVPEYRKAVAPLVIDGVTMTGIIKGQLLPITMVPEDIRDQVTDDIYFTQPIAEVADLLSTARHSGKSIMMAPSGSQLLVALINHHMASSHQTVERVYHQVNASLLSRVLDVVRTNLVELVAEMRTGAGGGGLPSREIAEQAVDVVIYGKRNRVTINQVGSNGTGVAAGRTATLSDGEPESPARRVMWWIVGIAGIVAAVAAVLVLL